MIFGDLSDLEVLILEGQVRYKKISIWDTVSRYGKGDLNVGEEILDMVKQSSGLIRGNLGIGHRNQYHDIVQGTRFVGGGNLVHDRRPKGVDCSVDGSELCVVVLRKAEVARRLRVLMTESLVALFRGVVL